MDLLRIQRFDFRLFVMLLPFWALSISYGIIGYILMSDCEFKNLVQGIEVEGRNFAGNPLGSLSAFSVMTGLALVFGYALLGSTWLIMKTEDTTQDWTRNCAAYVLALVTIFMGLVSLTMPFLNADVKNLWFSLPNFFYLLPMPLPSAAIVILLWRNLRTEREFQPFFLSLGLFFMNYIGLGISMCPWLVPFEVTLRQAAAAPESQSLLIVGTAVMLPVVLAYTAFCYYIFRGKTSHETIY